MSTSTIRPPLPTVATPRGLGAYVRGDVAGWSSADAARRAAVARSARLRWVVLMVEAVDGRRVDLHDLQRAATAYAEQGLSVALWTFPHPVMRDPEYAVEALERALVGLESVGVPCAGVILDVEATDGGRMRPSAAWARELVQRADELAYAADYILRPERRTAIECRSFAAQLDLELWRRGSVGSWWPHVRAAALRSYHVSPTDLVVAERHLAVLVPTVRAGGVVSSAGLTAIRWLDRHAPELRAPGVPTRLPS